MKILLLKDVYKLGRAGDIKKVANGYGRNYLIPQGLAILATPQAIKQAERIREKGSIQRDILNKEMDAVAVHLEDLTLTFAARASETGKLYGSVTTQMIVDAVREKSELELTRRQIDSQPLRMLGEHMIPIRLTVDLIPEIKAIVYREGESLEAYLAEIAAEAASEGEEFETDEAGTAIDEAAEAEPPQIELTGGAEDVVEQTLPEAETD